MKPLLYLSRETSRKPAAVSGLCMLLAILSFLPVWLGKAQNVYAQLSMLVFLCLSVYLWYRHIATVYLYRTEDDGKIWFSVTQKQGRRAMTLCRFDLSDLLSVAEETSFSKEKGLRWVRFSAAFFPKTYTVFRFRDGKSTVALKLSCDKTFAAEVLAAADEAKKRREEAETV